jgi:predicted DNA binding CopG/RHH family protein
MLQQQSEECDQLRIQVEQMQRALAGMPQERANHEALSRIIEAQQHTLDQNEEACSSSRSELQRFRNENASQARQLIAKDVENTHLRIQVRLTSPVLRHRWPRTHRHYFYFQKVGTFQERVQQFHVCHTGGL